MTIELGRGAGPLRGVRVVEITNLGPVPHAATILADLGADVIRVDRPDPEFEVTPRRSDLMSRGRPSVVLDLKHPAAVGAVLDLAATADVLIEGMRPGVMERLGLGPEVCMARNPRLIYGRLTGWGQTGPWANVPGHDLNYIAMTGALDMSGQDPERPHFPGATIGDFGGGSTYLVIGVLAALLEAKTSGQGQVIDAAIIDGAAHENLLWSSMLAAGAPEKRGTGIWSGKTPNYDVYKTADGRHMAVASGERKFLVQALALLDIDVALTEDPAALKAAFVSTFASKSFAEWCALFDGTQTCVVPVLPHSEAARHPHLVARGTFVERGGVVQPGPAPRFSRTETALSMPPTLAGEHTREALLAWGVDPEPLLEAGAARQG